MWDMAKKQKQQAGEWRNRIVRTGTAPASEFKANELNWRVHPKAQRDALKGVLSEVGWVTGVITNVTTGNVIDGHARIEEALKLGDETPVPFVEVELSEAEEMKILATLDPLSAMAGADKEQLDALLREVETGDAAVMQMLDDLAKANGLDYGKEGANDADAEPQMDKADELRVKWGVERGQVWQLGEHRLMCGDCTDAAVVARVMGGEKAALCVTSPPYGVGKDYEVGGVGEWLATIEGCFTVAANHADVWFVNISNKRTGGDGFETNNFSMMESAFSSLGYKLIGLRIWIKAPAWSQNPYWLQTYKPVDDFEFLGTFAKTKPKYKKRLTDEEYRLWGWRGAWEIASVQANNVHSAMFPVELPSRAIKLLTDDSAIVYEPFSGSGTTIIACEQLGRKCRAMEISEAYTAVALERWHQATGKTPALLDS